MNSDVIVNLIVGVGSGVIGALLTIGKYREKVDRLEKDRDAHDKRLVEMKTDLDRLAEFKVSTQKYIDSKLYTSNSPLSLTAFGKKLVKDSGFLDIFDDVKDDLVSKLEELSPATQYDTQEKARALMGDLSDYEAFQPIKDYAFKTGQDFQQILRAGALQLRDYYFSKHPEITELGE